MQTLMEITRYRESFQMFDNSCGRNKIPIKTMYSYFRNSQGRHRFYLHISWRLIFRPESNNLWFTNCKSVCTYGPWKTVFSRFHKLLMLCTVFLPIPCAVFTTCKRAHDVKECYSTAVSGFTILPQLHFVDDSFVPIGGLIICILY